jgi:hypothetical protein
MVMPIKNHIVAFPETINDEKNEKSSITIFFFLVWQLIIEHFPSGDV